MELCRGEWRPQYSHGPLVPAGFQRAVAAHPNKPCLVGDDGTTLTFAQADAAAAALARRLVARGGVGRDAAVGILLDRSVNVVVAMLAVHKAGGCYVPLDPNVPCDRLAWQVEDSDAVAVITEPKHVELAKSLLAGLPRHAQVLLAHDPDDAAAHAGVALPDLALQQADDLAYVMFTSGSTGRPKGVMVTQRGVRDLVAFNVEKFKLGPSDVFCLNSTVGFDSYVTYVFASLTVGGRLVVPGPAAHLDPYSMAGLIAAHGITVMEVVPALASEYLPEFKAAGSKLASLKVFLTGGEALTPSLAQDICASLPGLAAPGGGLFNSYGPTEATVTTITGHVTAPFDRIAMGRPDHNVHTYVVVQGEQGGAAGQPAPRPRLAAVGEPGELWLSGPRLARGYRNRPDLTAAAFVANPFLEQALAGLPASAACLRPHYALAYRTGDLVAMRPDGSIDFLGRVDRQVKVNGVRMEVSEIEAVLAGAPGATHAAVKPWKDASGAYRLCGYVAPAGVDLAAADAHLRSKLLPAMVPGKLVALPHLPRLPSGKVDVKALEEPAWGPAAAADSDAGGDAVVAASTPLEQLLLGIWAEVLHLPPAQLSVAANFFALGGSSLRAGLINSKVRRSTGYDISGLLIYQHANVRDMAAAIERQYGAFDPAAGSAPGGGSAAGSFVVAAGGGSSFTSSSAPACTVLVGGAGGRASPGAGPGSVAEEPAGRGLPVWLATLLQLLGLALVALGAFALFLPSFLGLMVLYGQKDISLVWLPLVGPVIMFGVLVLGVAGTVALKWLLLGRMRPRVAPLWGLYYVRWWLVRLAVKTTLAGLFPLLRNTPVLTWYYRALGARIGRNVMIDSFNVTDWDLLDIGNDAVIESDAFLMASSFHAARSPSERGCMVLAKTTIGAGCTICTQSIVSGGTSLAPGCILTPGSTSARPPSGPQDAAAHDAVRTEPGFLPAPLWILSTFVLAAVTSLVMYAFVPVFLIWTRLNANLTSDWRDLMEHSLGCWLLRKDDRSICVQLWWTNSVATLALPAVAFAVGNAFMWAMVPIKWLLVGRTSEATMHNAGLWLQFRRHLWRCLIKGAFQLSVFQWTSTEVFNIWLRCLGAKVGRQCWLSEMFHCSEFDLYEVEDTASVCSMVTVIGSTNARAARVKLCEACDVTNDCTLMPGATVNKGACLGVFSYALPDQEFAEYSITQGEFVLRGGVAAKDVEAGVATGKLEDASSRLLPAWQYAAYNVAYLAGALTIFMATACFMYLPPLLVSLAVLFNLGVWASLAFVPVYAWAGFALLLLYLTVLKRVVMADTGGEHPIFTSSGAGRWQALCINCHMYGDFNALKGSVLYNWYLRCMGAKVGADVLCLGGVVHEYEQVSIGDGTVIGDASFVLTHTVESRRVKIRPIAIGQRVTIGALCAVLPDATMEDDTQLADMSLVMKGETVPRGSLWRGLPACAVAKKWEL